jgi:hypothetical protein
MAVPNEQALINTGRSGDFVKIKDIVVCDDVEEKPFGVVKYPFKITIVRADMNEEVVAEERTKGDTYTSKWFSKFYVKVNTGTDGKVYEKVRYTRDHLLLALVQLHEMKTGKSLPKDFNIKNFEGFTFEASVRTDKDGKNSFIDVAETLRMNGIKVPTVEELQGIATPPQGETSTVDDVTMKDVRAALSGEETKEVEKTGKNNEDELPF